MENKQLKKLNQNLKTLINQNKYQSDSIFNIEANLDHILYQTRRPILKRLGITKLHWALTISDLLIKAGILYFLAF